MRPCPYTVCASKVYVAATHLEGMEKAETLLRALGRNVQDVIALHTMTIIEDDVEGSADLKVCVMMWYDATYQCTQRSLACHASPAHPCKPAHAGP